MYASVASELELKRMHSSGSEFDGGELGLRRKPGSKELQKGRGAFDETDELDNDGEEEED
jgi:hypothetical protein